MPVAIIGLAGGLIQAGISAENKKKDQDRSDALFAKRQPYKTPSEILDVYNMSEQAAQSGYDPTTLSYMTSQAQGSLAGGLNTATKLGADPNQLSAMLDQNFQNIFQIGGNNDLLKMKKFDNLINATQLLAQNKDAEFASRDNLLKDQLQTVAQRTQEAGAGVQSGVNLALNSATALQRFYQDKKNPPPKVPGQVAGLPTAFTPPPPRYYNGSIQTDPYTY